MNRTPDVRFESGKFVAYCDDVRIYAFENSQDAWQAARAVAFGPTSSEASHTACTPVTITRKRFDDDADCTGPSWLEYTCGDVAMLWEHNDFEFLSMGNGPKNLRDLYTLLAHPAIQAHMGLTPAPIVKPCYSDVEPGTSLIHFIHKGVIITDSVEEPSELLNVVIGDTQYEFTREELRAVRALLMSEAMTAYLDVA